MKVQLIVIAVFIFGCVQVDAHDSWVSQGAFKNTNGEWCCGSVDCKSYDKVVALESQGWLVDGEFIPYDEALPFAPPDGMVTVCRRPDGSRRCVFGLKPGN
jgi:hypothetical protein